MAVEPLSSSRLEQLQRDTFGYFVHEANPANGLVRDNTRYGAPCSIAALGLALSSYPVAVARGYLRRDEAAGRTRMTLRFLCDLPQGPEPDAAGHRGFFYHFLDLHTGLRVHGCELSTMDSAILFAGALCAAAFFDGAAAAERDVRELADALYRRADWRWALAGGAALSHGWLPEGGFLPYRWRGYNEALLLYVLALGSPTHPIGRRSYAAWTETYRWRRVYGQEVLYGGPLFMHQLSHVWIDWRGIQDDFMRARRSDYFENSRRATHVQREYARRNPRGWRGYGENCWGISASEGPGPALRRVGGRLRRFWGYRARGVPFGPDDGTLAPWGTAASLPFAPEIVLPALRHFEERYPETRGHYGFLCSFNPSFPARGGKGWVAGGHLGLDQGPVVLMIENYRSGLLWRLMGALPYVRAGLRRAGFSGGWLGRRRAAVTPPGRSAAPAP